MSTSGKLHRVITLLAERAVIIWAGWESVQFTVK